MKYIEIPKLFQSFKDGRKFENCIVCNKYLLQDGIHYIIEKAIRNYPTLLTHDIIFEYAMCFECMESLKDEISEESMNNINKYFEEKVDLKKRFEESQMYGLDYNEFISKCIVTGKSIFKLNEYVIQGHCIGNQMKLSFMPYMISETAMDEISELLSNKTLDFLNRFMDKHFGYPPEVREILSKRLVLL